MIPDSYIVRTIKGNAVDAIRDAEALDVFEKQKLYLKHYIYLLMERHNFHVEVFPDKIFLIPWTMIHPFISFDQYCSRDNIHRVSHGANWKEQGFATESRIEFSGLYNNYLHTR